jgi:outer membrane protein assembly factor BamB
VFEKGAGKDTIYTAAGNFVYKIANIGSLADEIWYYDALAQVESGPISWNGTAYFGSNTPRYFAVDDATGLIESNWPLSVGSGNASAGPWIEPFTNQIVIFGSTGGNLDAYDLLTP